jgi:hypothetical protein
LVRDPAPVLDAAYRAADDGEAAYRLPAMRDWTPQSIIVVLDVQFRRFLPDQLDRIDAALRETRPSDNGGTSI